MPTFKRVSADEAQAKRQHHLKSVDAGTAVVKALSEPSSWNENERSAKFIMSSETPDRYADIVVQAGLKIDNFLKNPVGLLFHNSRTWPCGQWSDITKVLNGRPRRTEGKLTFVPKGIDEDADRAARHVAAGSIRSVSIGFIPNWDEVDMIINDEGEWTGGLRFNESELIECSLVPIPAQPDALVKDAGGNFKIARSLLEDVLDNWAKTPEGLIIPRKEYEEKYREMFPAKPVVTIRVEGDGLDKDTIELIENGVAEVLRDHTAVENKASEGEAPDDEMDSEEDGTKPGECGTEADVSKGDEPDGDSECEPEEESTTKSVAVAINLDTTAAETSISKLSAEIEAVDSKADGLLKKLRDLFGFTGKSAAAEKVEPSFTEEKSSDAKPAPTPEEIAAVRAGAIKALALVQLQGLKS